MITDTIVTNANPLSRKKQRQKDVLAEMGSLVGMKPTDIRHRLFEVGDNVMGPCTENEIIEGVILAIKEVRGVWKICVDPYKIGGVPFRGYVRWIEKYRRFIKL